MERELARRYKVNFEREKRQLEENAGQLLKAQMATMKQELDQKIAELARLKSLEQVRLRKFEEQKRELLQQIEDQKRDV